MVEKYIYYEDPLENFINSIDFDTMTCRTVTKDNVDFLNENYTIKGIQDKVNQRVEPVIKQPPKNDLCIIYD